MKANDDQEIIQVAVLKTDRHFYHSFHQSIMVDRTKDVYNGQVSTPEIEDILRDTLLEADGTIRLYFTVEQAQKKLHRSRQCVTRIFRELEYSGLICRKKQGLGKPALITLNYPSNAKLIRPKEAGENLSG